MPDSGTPGDSDNGVSLQEPPATGEQAAAVPAVEVRGISKDFGSNRALDSVDLSLAHGEVLGLLGQNGSGKSTLVKVLAGVYDPEPGGRLFVGGEEVALPLAPGQASQIGLSFVYQNLALAPGLSVLENLTLSQRIGGGLSAWEPINWIAEHKTAAAVLDRYDVRLDLDRRTGELAPVDQARLAIVRAAEDLRRYRTRSGYKHSVLVLDEPTVFLPEEEVDRLFDLIRTVVAEGAAVLFISHDLTAVRAITDRVVVLRDGRVLGEEVTADIREEELVDLIVGAPARNGDSAQPVLAPVEDQHAVALTLAAMESAGDQAAVAAGESVIVEHLTDERLHDLSFEIGAGEILGVAGLIGSGAEELPYLLFGARPAGFGTLRLGAETMGVAGLSPQRSVRERIALVPADRAVQGLSQSLTLWENIVMLVEGEHFRRGVFHRGELVTLAREAIRRFLIRPPWAHSVVSTFSGGNQQKALIAKWLLARPRLLLLHEPTQGVDVGARRDIYRFVQSAAALHHMAVLWVTTEFGELAEVCDRVIVVTQGRHTATLAGEELTEEAISAAALRQTREDNR
ncbi:sugar ABC transporter ATP-binding protein [Trebonia kvetii]|uniref:sugar ABC transporter ATP-binding protein n=1 Tax=Trebonia kvetii TaxID=2480626 RepID=UPI0016528430|nr:sugar ABC transporter ATP-binding protein [Trebonia kvetii]